MAAAVPVTAAMPAMAAVTAVAVSCRGEIRREGDERERERRNENRHKLLHLERPLERVRSIFSGDPLVDRPDPSPPIRAIRIWPIALPIEEAVKLACGISQ
jgi:hypothetical protein